MKNLVYIIGLGFLGVIAYQLVMRKKDDSVLQDPIINPTLQTQPSNKYPETFPLTPRVDNADQPWYGGLRDFFGTVDDTLQSLQHGSATIMNYNTEQVWDELSQKYTIH